MVLQRSLYVLRKGGVQNIDGVRPDDVGNISIWDMLHRYGVNYVPSDTSNAGWNSLGLCVIFYTKSTIDNQPTTFGQLINIPAELSSDAAQIWIEQPGGRIWYRAGNPSIPINGTKFKAVATTDEVSSVTDKVNRVTNEVNSALDNLKGNHTPVITDIFDRAGTIDLSFPARRLPPLRWGMNGGA